MTTPFSLEIKGSINESGEEHRIGEVTCARSTDDSGVSRYRILASLELGFESVESFRSESESLESSGMEGEYVREGIEARMDEILLSLSAQPLASREFERLLPRLELALFLRCRGRFESALRLRGLGGVTRPPLVSWNLFASPFPRPR